VGPRLWARGRTPKNEHLGVIFHAYGEKTNPGRICTKFCMSGDIQDVITDANLGDDRLSRFYVAMGQILGFSIGFCSRPYNTLALPCECVTYDHVVMIECYQGRRDILRKIILL